MLRLTNRIYIGLINSPHVKISVFLTSWKSQGGFLARKCVYWLRMCLCCCQVNAKATNKQIYKSLLFTSEQKDLGPRRCCDAGSDLACIDGLFVTPQAKISGTWSWAGTGTTASRSRSQTWWSSRPSSPASAGPVGSYSWASASGFTGGGRRGKVWATTQVREGLHRLAGTLSQTYPAYRNTRVDPADNQDVPKCFLF